MNPAQLFRLPGPFTPALFEAALWIAAEHDASVQPALILHDLGALQQQVSLACPCCQRMNPGQPLLRRMNDLGFAQDDHTPLRPAAALLDKVLQRKRGQTLGHGPDRIGDGTAPGYPHGRRELPGTSCCGYRVPITCWTLAAAGACTLMTVASC